MDLGVSGFEPEVNNDTGVEVIRFPVVMDGAAAQAPPVPTALRGVWGFGCSLVPIVRACVPVRMVLSCLPSDPAR